MIRIKDRTISVNPDLTIEEPVGFLVVPQAEWANHPWLCTLNSGSDTEGDSAYFWSDLNDAEFASFSSIVFQVSEDGQSWRPAISAAGSFFPSRDWARAQIGLFENH